METIRCQLCGKEFRAFLSAKRKFCSTICFKKSRRHLINRQDLWSEQEIEELKKLYPSATIEEILERLPHRTIRAVNKQAGKMGLRRNYLLRYDPLANAPKLNLAEHEKAWLACALDGEGSIMASRNGAGYYYIRIIVCNTNKDWLGHFGELINGISWSLKVHDRNRKKVLYSVFIGKMSSVYCLLKEIRPHLIIKAKDADRAIELIDIHRAETVKTPVTKRISCTPRQLEIIEEMRKRKSSS